MQDNRNCGTYAPDGKRHMKGYLKVVNITDELNATVLRTITSSSCKQQHAQ
ncbi:MAG TPA: hypothetical protein VGJ84_22105 [Polyangiaceae bacterium]